MAGSAREFFEGLAARVDPSRAAGITNSYLFDVAGAGRWKVDVRDGSVSVEEGGESADVTISASEATFLRLIQRDLSPMSAYMTGKIKVKGDMGAAMRLQKLF